MKGVSEMGVRSLGGAMGTLTKASKSGLQGPTPSIGRAEQN